MVRTGLICGLMLFVAGLTQAKAQTPANLIAGKLVSSDASVSVGTRLVAVFEKKNYLVEIREVKKDGLVNILWLETKEESDDVPLNTLYQIGDGTQLRKSRTTVLPEAYRARDKNGDGQIGLSEWERSKYAEFKKLDKNRDGFLTPQELTVKTATTTGAANAAASGSATTDATKPVPANLLEFGAKVNETMTFTVTGKTVGGVYGSGPYAVESDLAATAVHAGVLKDGASGPVSVTIVAPADEFTGSLKNGVTSGDRKEKGPAFTIKAP